MQSGNIHGQVTFSGVNMKSEENESEHTMIFEDREVPPMLAIVGDERWTNKKAPMNGVLACATLVR